MTYHTTREAWLQAAIVHLAPIFRDAGHPLPDRLIKVACSWPGGGSARKRIGECWPSKASAAGATEIFISPLIADPVAALDILTHELCHAVDDCASGHRAAFVRTARAVGLEGKPTATIAGPNLRRALTAISVTLGDYPHATLSLAGRKKQSTRMLKVTCSDCDGVFRTTQKWIDEADHLSCPFCQSDAVQVG